MRGVHNLEAKERPSLLRAVCMLILMTLIIVALTGLSVRTFVWMAGL